MRMLQRGLPIFFAGGILLLGSCNQDDEATVTTKTGILVRDYAFDSVVVAVLVDGDTTDRFVKHHGDVDQSSQKIRWNIDAPENASITLSAQIWYEHRIVATQDYGWVSGKMPGEGGTPVPAPVAAPTILFNDTVRAYKDMSHGTRVPIWAFAATEAGEAEITDIAWDAESGGGWINYPSTGSTPAESTFFENDYRHLDTGVYQGRVRIQDGYGRSFVYPLRVEVLAGPATFTDARDGKAYRWRTIGRRDWMVDNLAYVGDSMTLANSWCYDNQDSNCTHYGRLYSWYGAVGGLSTSNNGICPDGWRLPRVEDFGELEFLAGMVEKPAVTWMAESLWVDNRIDSNQIINLGSDDLGFGVLPAGEATPWLGAMSFNGLGSLANFWTADYGNYPGESSMVSLGSALGMLNVGLGEDRENAYSVRCTRDRWYF